MAQLIFGTAGAPLSSQAKTTAAGIERIRELGLGCLEVQFVQGVRMGEASARVVREVAEKSRVRLSVHAPYFINFNAKEPAKLTASEGRLLQSARIGYMCGAEAVNVHLAFYLGDPPGQVYDRVKPILQRVVRQLRREGNPIIIRPEVMGKGSQFGTVEEVVSLSAEVDGVLPTIDFAHWHARTGQNNSHAEFVAILRQIESRLGRRGLENMHMHISGIAYGRAGETKHLFLKDSDFRYMELLRALKEAGAGGMAICESPPPMEADALVLQEAYRKL